MNFPGAFFQSISLVALTVLASWTGTLASSAPTASFSASTVNPAAGSLVQFSDTSGGTPTSWSWDFGDGTSSSERNPTHVYAAAGPDSFDCSGLTMYAWAAAGVSLSHNAAAQYESLPHVPMASLEPGDLVFYGSPIHHVGMYVGNGTMVEAPYTGVDVRYHSIYRPDFAGAARP